MQPRMRIAWPPLTTGIKILFAIYGTIFVVHPLFSGTLGIADEIEAWFYLSNEGLFRDFMLWQPLTYQLLHANFFHILFNGLVLYFFGGEVERRWTTKHFIGFVLGCGFGAGLFVVGWELLWGSIAVAQGADSMLTATRTVGASGGINAVIGAYIVYNWDRELRMMFIPKPIKGKWLLPLFIGFDLLMALAGSEVSVAGHLGGLALGLLICTGFYKPSRLMQRYKLWRFRRKVKTLAGGRPPENKNGFLH